MKLSIRILFLSVIFLICAGYYFKNTGDHTTGDKCIGIGIVLGAFILMPLFIYYRWKGKDVKAYMLTEENIKKMKDFNNTKRKG